MGIYLPTTTVEPTVPTSVTARVMQPTSTRKSVVGLPTSTVTTLTTKEKEQMLLAFLELLIENPEYDKGSDVLHNYINSLVVSLSGKTLAFTVQRQPDTADEFVQLGVDLILAAALTSQSGKPADWGLTRIEVISPGPSDSSAMLYVTGHENIVRLAEGKISIYDIMQTKIDWSQALVEVIASALNIRSGPGVDYQIIGKLSAGKQLEIIGIDSSGNWLQVVDGQDNIGWISGKPGYVRVLGSLDNVPVVQVSSPSPTSAVPSPAPTMPIYSKRVQECIPWTQANKYINETTCVWGIVTSTYYSENAFFINFSETDYSVFYGVSFDYRWDNLKGRCIILNGLIQTYEGRPEIIIEHPTQLESCD